MKLLRWLSSKTFREACTVLKHYRRLFNSQVDILSPPAIEAMQSALAGLKAAIRSGQDKAALTAKGGELQAAAERWLKPYPHAGWRENVEVLLVALAVAVGIRTFFLQPFKIPTGSMQPTLFGVTSEPDFGKMGYWPGEKDQWAEMQKQAQLQADLQIPTGWERVKRWFAGESYLHVVAKADGQIDSIGKPFKIPFFNIRQSFTINGVEHTLWFLPDFGSSSLEQRAGIGDKGCYCNKVFHKGEDVIRMKVTAGDHLFVDRLTYNFRKPKRGEIIVFATQGISTMPPDQQDQFYIKRLVVMPHEKVRIGDDRHVVVNGRRLDATTPHFEKVYSFDPTKPPQESQYSGHLNNAVAKSYRLYPYIAPLFPDGQRVHDNDGNTYMVMGDNTCNSSDSRTWGAFPASNVIGRNFFIYWPFTRRFGVGTE